MDRLAFQAAQVPAPLSDLAELCQVALAKAAEWAENLAAEDREGRAECQEDQRHETR